MSEQTNSAKKTLFQNQEGGGRKREGGNDLMQENSVRRRQLEKNIKRYRRKRLNEIVSKFKQGGEILKGRVGVESEMVN